MDKISLPFGYEALLILGLFVLTLLCIGFLAYANRRNESLEDFYLAGRNLGFGVLLLTFYATQYSGNTLLGFSAAAYRKGFRFLVCTHFMTAIVIAYLLFAPELYRLNREHRFLTPGDFIFYRYRSHTLRIIVTLLMIYTLCNFTVAQMKTLGIAFAGISQGRVPMWMGVLSLIIVMLIYENIGGMRSVAWTDAIQGGILFVGFILLLIMAWLQIGDLSSATTKLAANPLTQFKIDPPESNEAVNWISFVLIVGFGGAIYPQAIQRIYAANDVKALKRSLSVMAFLPLATTLVVVSVGVIMAGHRPELNFTGPGSIPQSETVLTALCYEVMTNSELGYWLVIIIFAALIAAVMSTVDSALLSIGSMIVQDLYRQYIRPQANQAHLTSMGHWITWILMIPVTWAALWYKGNLIELLQLKFEFLIQCGPAIYLGIHWKSLTSQTVLTGIFFGLTLTITLYLGGANSLWGLHPGMAGLLINLAVCGTDSFMKKKDP